MLGLRERGHGARREVHEEELLVHAHSQPGQGGLQEVLAQPGEAADAHRPEALATDLSLPAGEWGLDCFHLY